MCRARHHRLGRPSAAALPKAPEALPLRSARGGALSGAAAGAAHAAQRPEPRRGGGEDRRAAVGGGATAPGGHRDLQRRGAGGASGSGGGLPARGAEGLAGLVAGGHGSAGPGALLPLSAGERGAVKGSVKGVCLVEMALKEGAEAAVKLKTFELMGSKVSCSRRFEEELFAVSKACFPLVSPLKSDQFRSLLPPIPA